MQFKQKQTAQKIQRKSNHLGKETFLTLLSNAFATSGLSPEIRPFVPQYQSPNDCHIPRQMVFAADIPFCSMFHRGNPRVTDFSRLYGQCVKLQQRKWSIPPTWPLKSHTMHGPICPNYPTIQDALHYKMHPSFWNTKLGYTSMVETLNKKSPLHKTHPGFWSGFLGGGQKRCILYCTRATGNYGSHHNSHGFLSQCIFLLVKRW